MVTPLTFVGDEEELLRALRERHPGAVAVFYDRHAAHVQRALRSALGPDADLPDLLQEVFIRAIDGIGELEDLTRVRSWLTTIAVFTARAQIRRRARRNRLGIFSPQRTSVSQAEPAPLEALSALRQTYGVLDELPLNERMAFVLRFVNGLTLPEAAEACRVSLATFKRRLARAERLFVERARSCPALLPWLEDGKRWSLEKLG
ncbi:MAG TPA: RNA polymerase sigma factor [Polyangiaceae bacterium]